MAGVAGGVGIGAGAGMGAGAGDVVTTSGMGSGVRVESLAAGSTEAVSRSEGDCKAPQPKTD